MASAQLQSQGSSLLVISGQAHLESSGERVAFAVGTFNLYGSLEGVDLEQLGLT